MTNQSKSNRKALTLVEILIASVIVSVFLVPSFFLFRSARVIQANSKQLFTISAMANSQLTIWLGMESESLNAMGRTAHENLATEIKGLFPPEQDMLVFHEISEFSTDSIEKFFKVQVQVEYTNKVTQKPAVFTLSRLVFLD